MLRIKKIFYFMFVLTLSIGLVFAENEKKVPDADEDFDKKVEEEVLRKLSKIMDKGVVEFSKDLLNKEKLINKREKEIKLREDEIKIIEYDLSKRIKNFSKRQEKLLGCISDNEKKIGQRVQYMVDVISGMKALKAAEVLSVQDPSISVQILSKLEADKTSKIFNVMEREVSARLQKEYMNMKR